MVITGENIVLFVDKKGTAGYQPLGAGKTCSLNVSADAIDASNKSIKKWKASIASKVEWEVTSQILMSSDESSYTLKDLFDVIMSDANIRVAIALDGVYYLGDGIITSLSLNATDNEIITLDVTLKGNGDLTESSAAPADLQAAIAALVEIPLNKYIFGTDFCMVDETNHLIGSAKNFTLELSRDTLEVASKKTGRFKGYVKALASWSINGELNTDSDDSYNTQLLAAMTNGTPVNVEARLLQDPKETDPVPVEGSVKISGKGIVSSFGLTANNNEIATYSYSLTGEKELIVDNLPTES